MGTFLTQQGCSEESTGPARFKHQKSAIHQGLIPGRTDSDQGDRRLEFGRDPIEIGPRVGGQLLHAAALLGRGLPAGPPRKPMQPLNKDDRRALEQVIRVMNTTFAEIQEGKQ